MALDFVAGCLGGCAGLVVGHPLDTIKVRIQMQDAKNPIYKGTWNCFTEIVKKESFVGLYKGLSSPIAGVAFVNAIVFGTYGNIMKHSDDPNSLRAHMLAGATAGFLQSFIASPMELAKSRMQIMAECSNKVLYKSPLDCMSQILKREGIVGVFRGQTITTMREVPGFATYFVSYEWMVRKLSPSNEVSSFAVLMAGGLAGIASWIITYPVDVIKTRIQTDGMHGPPRLKGITHCFRSSIATEGWAVLTRGLSAAIIRAFPTNAATFAVVSWTIDTFSNNVETEDCESILAIKTRFDEVLVATKTKTNFVDYTSIMNQKAYLSMQSQVSENNKRLFNNININPTESKQIISVNKFKPNKLKEDIVNIYYGYSNYHTNWPDNMFWCRGLINHNI